MHGDHADRCKGLVGARTLAHNLVRDALCTVAAEAKLFPVMEEVGLYELDPARRPADIRLRADVPHGLGTLALHAQLGVCIDVTHRALLADTHVGSAPATVLQRAYSDKLGIAPPADHFMRPVAFASGGGFHERSLADMLSKWAAHVCAGTEDEDEGRGVKSAERLVALKWLPRLSVAVHNGYALKPRALLRALGGGADLQRGDFVGLAHATRVLQGDLG